jgi:NAD(P) transhydrogenase subunit alpha
MLIGVPRETAAGETRVSVTPETAKKLTAQGHDVRVQNSAGAAASATDEAYAASGASLTDAAGALGCDLVLKVRSPSDDELFLMKPGAVLAGMLDPFDRDGLRRFAGAGITASRSRRRRARRVRRAWTCCPRRPTSPATRP